MCPLRFFDGPFEQPGELFEDEICSETEREQYSAGDFGYLKRPPVSEPWLDRKIEYDGRTRKFPQHQDDYGDGQLYRYPRYPLRDPFKPLECDLVREEFEPGPIWKQYALGEDPFPEKTKTAKEPKDDFESCELSKVLRGVNLAKRFEGDQSGKHLSELWSKLAKDTKLFREHPFTDPRFVSCNDVEFRRLCDETSEQEEITSFGVVLTNTDETDSFLQIPVNVHGICPVLRQADRFKADIKVTDWKKCFTTFLRIFYEKRVITIPSLDAFTKFLRFFDKVTGGMKRLVNHIEFRFRLHMFSYDDTITFRAHQKANGRHLAGDGFDEDHVWAWRRALEEVPGKFTLNLTFHSFVRRVKWLPGLHSLLCPVAEKLLEPVTLKFPVFDERLNGLKPEYLDRFKECIGSDAMEDWHNEWFEEKPLKWREHIGQFHGWRGSNDDTEVSRFFTYHTLGSTELFQALACLYVASATRPVGEEARDFVNELMEFKKFFKNPENRREYQDYCILQQQGVIA